jgi:hypothetical protein
MTTVSLAVVPGFHEPQNPLSVDVFRPVQRRATLTAAQSFQRCVALVAEIQGVSVDVRKGRTRSATWKHDFREVEENRDRPDLKPLLILRVRSLLACKMNMSVYKTHYEQ